LGLGEDVLAPYKQIMGHEFGYGMGDDMDFLPSKFAMRSQ